MYTFGGISAAQIKAARALLNWSQDELAAHCSLSVATIRKLELGHISPRASTNEQIRNCLQTAGLEFLDQDGVRRCHEDVSISEGPDALSCLFNDMRQTLSAHPGEVLFVAGMEIALAPTALRQHWRGLESIFVRNSLCSAKCLMTDCAEISLSSPHFEIRRISSNYIDPAPCYVYGDKHALILPGPGLADKVVIVRSIVAAQQARRQFFSIWEMAAPTPCTEVFINAAPCAATA